MRVEEKTVYRHALLAVLATLVLAGSAMAGQAGKSPVKVFILAGQSNMEGQGFIGGGKGTLEFLAKDPASAPRYKHLLDKDGKWAVRDDVWCSYGNKGRLTVGGFAADGAIGPELGIGWVLGDYLDNQVLLIKVAVGGTSLAQNWRPPSSGGEVGWLYKAVLETVKNLPTTIKADFPDYDGKGYEIAGFCWHQGWQDGCVDSMAREYEKNMVNFIKDIRKDLGVSNLPFVIGGSGFGGWQQANTRRLKISAAQKAAAEREEFKGNVLYVETRPFFRPKEESPTAFGYHWNCNAETYYLIGEGMGKAMVELLGGPKAPANAMDPNPKKVKKSSGPKVPPPTVVKLDELTLDLGNKVTMKLLKIPAGKFLMGSPEAEEGRRGNEGPQREVTISKPFYMGMYEVTVDQYAQFAKDSGYSFTLNSSYHTRGDHPITYVAWNDTQAFCQWLSKKTGKVVSLPTESQWEYACRAGTSTIFSFGNDEEDLAQYAHYDADGWDGTAQQSLMFAPVGSFKPNPFGLYDMHGNVNEWCSDFYADTYSIDEKTDPKGPEKGEVHVVRGGGWRSKTEGCRSAWRNKFKLSGNRDGFRVVMAVQ